MKLSTYALAFGPAVLVLAAKFALDPGWLRAWSMPARLGIGALIGVFGAVMARMVEPQD